MKVRPLNDWVVIIPDEAEERTAGGIYIPDAAKDKPAEGVVEAAGPGAYEEERPGKKQVGKKKERKFIPTSVRPGDHVLYEKYAGQRITVGPRELLLVREKHVLGYLPARPKAAPADPAPAQFPLVQVKTGERSLMKRGASDVALAHQHEAGALKPAAAKAAGKKAAKKTAQKAAKKTVKKTARKAAGKPQRKAAPKPAKKKAAAKKTKKKR